MSFTYHNPVKIHYNTSLENALAHIKGELPSRILLVTSRGWLMRGIAKRIESALPHARIHIISDITPNPELSHLQALKAKLSGEQAIIALGGGSVLDSAKFFAMQGSISASGGELHINHQGTKEQGRTQEAKNTAQNMEGHTPINATINANARLDSSVLADMSFSTGLVRGKSPLNLQRSALESKRNITPLSKAQNIGTLESSELNLQALQDSKLKQDSKLGQDSKACKAHDSGLHTSNKGTQEGYTQEGRAQDMQSGRAQEVRQEPTALPLFAFPTTAGTSSELTQWATIWDSAARVKYSLSHPALYPQMAAYDMSLFASLPREVLLHTTLDSLSHACEAIWNKNANPISTHHALRAIELILAYLPRLLGDLRDCVARECLVRASIHAGLAFSNTQTALAHAISYPITMESGVPHGLACSFSLPLLCECIIDEAAKSTLEPYRAEITRLFERLGVSVRARDYGLDSARIEMIFERLNARAKNGLLDIERAKEGLKASAK